MQRVHLQEHLRKALNLELWRTQLALTKAATKYRAKSVSKRLTEQLDGMERKLLRWILCWRDLH